jgi:predicted Ser/Thr protein kinase
MLSTGETQSITFSKSAAGSEVYSRREVKAILLSLFSRMRRRLDLTPAGLYHALSWGRLGQVEGKMGRQHSTNGSLVAADQDDNPAMTAGGPEHPRAGRSRAAHWFGRCFYACGDAGLPPEIACLGGRYALEKVLKHDFHAATGLYRKQEFEVSSVRCEGNPQPDASDFKRPSRLVCKINRRMHFCFLPLGWVGRLMTRSEISKLQRCEGIPEVPRVLARLDAHTYVYEYIEGLTLDDRPPLPADFFDRLADALRRIHARHIVHFDLHKRSNILIDTEGGPHIIDFQIARHIGDRFLLSRRLSACLRRWLQSYDIYHIYKYKRRFQPQFLTEAEEKLSYNHGWPLELQRTLVWPYKKIRRAILRYLYTKGILTGTADAGTCKETNPARWIKTNSAAPKDE